MKSGSIKIVAPASAPDEARTLPGLGADELYFSVQPPGARTATSRRELPRANFSDAEEVELAVRIAIKRNARLFVALNKTFYIDREMREVKRLLDRCLEAGVHGAIVADPGLLRLLHGEKYPDRAEIVLSTVAAATNAEAVKFFSRFGISRVILPRTTGPEAAARLVKKFPRLDFEVLIFNWYCANLDGACRFQHDLADPDRAPDLARNGCCLECEISRPGGEPAPVHISSAFSEVYRRSDTACGACSMYDFAIAGVKYFKAAGRLLERKQKEDSVIFLGDCRAILENCGDGKKFQRLARRRYETFFGKPCSGVCYHGIREAAGE